MQQLQGATLDFKAPFSKKALLEALRRNKETFMKDYADACDVYFVDLQKALKELQDDAAGRKFRADEYRLDTYGKMKPPINATKLYIQYIDMLELAQSDTIELSPSDYNAIINDEWDWAKAAKLVNSTYSLRKTF